MSDASGVEISIMVRDREHLVMGSSMHGDEDKRRAKAWLADIEGQLGVTR